MLAVVLSHIPQAVPVVPVVGFTVAYLAGVSLPVFLLRILLIVSFAPAA